MRGKECEKFLLQRVQIEGVRCDTVLAESAEIHDTCIRPRRCVCGSMFNVVARAHMYQLSAWQQQSSSQRVGALLIRRPAWVDHNTGGSPARTLAVHWRPKGMAVGGPTHSSAQQYSAETRQTVSLAYLSFSSFIDVRVLGPRLTVTGFTVVCWEQQIALTRVRTGIDASEREEGVWKER